MAEEEQQRDAEDMMQETPLEKVMHAGEGKVTGEELALTPEEAKARRKRNIAIALGVLAFIAIVYLTTILRYAANIEAGR